MSHLCKSRHRKKVLENFLKFISQERHTRILNWSAQCLYPNLFLNRNEVHNLNMNFTKIVITNFHEKLRKLSFMFFSEIQIIKDV